MPNDLLTRAVDRHRQGHTEQAEALYRLTLAAEPDEPNALAMLAAIERTRGEHDKARDKLVRAVANAPDRPDFREALGDVSRVLGDHDAAMAAYDTAIETNPERPDAWLRKAALQIADGAIDEALALLDLACSSCRDSAALLDMDGATAINAGFYERAEHSFRRARAVDPDRLDLMVKHGAACLELGRSEQAIVAFKAAIDAGAGTPEVETELALACFVSGRLDEGWDHYEARWQVHGEAPPPALASRAWDGRIRPDLRLLVCAEQGVGDQIMFASGLPALHKAIASSGKLIIECAAKLAPLFARAWPDATVHATEGATGDGRVRSSYRWLADHEPIDAVTYLGELPRHLMPTIDGKSYLAADPARVDEWRTWLSTLGSGPTIGVCWRSSLSSSHRDHRVPPLAAWRDVFQAFPDAHFINLQYHDPDGRSWGELAHETPIHTPPGLDQFDDLDGVAALLSGLDLVISAPTAVAALSGALGCPTLRVLRGCDWSLLGRQTSPFFNALDTVLLTRDWHGPTGMQPVIAAARRRLRS